jgi:hypothetical protein
MAVISPSVVQDADGFTVGKSTRYAIETQPPYVEAINMLILSTFYPTSKQ